MSQYRIVDGELHFPHKGKSYQLSPFAFVAFISPLVNQAKETGQGDTFLAGKTAEWAMDVLGIDLNMVEADLLMNLALRAHMEIKKKRDEIVNSLVFSESIPPTGRSTKKKPGPPASRTKKRRNASKQT